MFVIIIYKIITYFSFEACDWWGLGLTLFECITGHLPFGSPDSRSEDTIIR